MVFPLIASNALFAVEPAPFAFLSDSDFSPRLSHSSSIPSDLSVALKVSGPGYNITQPIRWKRLLGLGSLRLSQRKPPSPSVRCSLQKSSIFSRFIVGAIVLIKRVG